MIGEVFKVLGLCLTVSAICIIIKPQNSEYALFASVAAGFFISLLLFKKICAPLESIKNALDEYGIQSEYFKVALKAVGIGYVTTFIADICRDSGQTSIAQKAIFAGKCAVFLLSVPLIMSILDTAVGFLK